MKDLDTEIRLQQSGVVIINGYTIHVFFTLFWSYAYYNVPDLYEYKLEVNDSTVLDAWLHYCRKETTRKMRDSKELRDYACLFHLD